MFLVLCCWPQAQLQADVWQVYCSTCIMLACLVASDQRLWLGAGAPFLPYLITDRVVAPESCRKCYSEHLVLMPNCYFVNDYKRAHMVPCPPPPARTGQLTLPPCEASPSPHTVHFKNDHNWSM